MPRSYKYSAYFQTVSEQSCTTVEEEQCQEVTEQVKFIFAILAFNDEYGQNSQPAERVYLFIYWEN